MSTAPVSIRNFVIIAHVDHGKSTLADRLLELTGTVEARKMQPQYLDQMELERERGITIKMQPVRMMYRYRHTVLPPVSSDVRPRTPNDTDSDNDAETCYVLNLIDTPGHADFAYEVSRALAAVEGAILLVDATQGVQAQTIANFELARAQGLTILPVVNKVDLAHARADEVADEIADLVGCPRQEVMRVSAKTGAGVPALAAAVIERIPLPASNSKFKYLNIETSMATPNVEPGRALIFDSHFDAYRGVVAHVRIAEGMFRQGERIRSVATGWSGEIVELGHFAPALDPSEVLGAGEIGYLATGLREPQAIRVGDTIARFKDLKIEGSAVEALPGYREPAPVVFASVYPANADDYERLSDALAKVKLNDAAIVFEPEASPALGRGFRMGFLGLLHMDIVGERLRREYRIDLVFAAPSVAYRLTRTDGSGELVYAASNISASSVVREIAEPWVALEVIMPLSSSGGVMEMLARTGGQYRSQRHLGRERIAVAYEAPLREILVDFADDIKRLTAGFGSFSYEVIGYRAADLVRLDIVIAGELQPALARVVRSSEAYRVGRRVVETLKDLLPRALFSVSIQAAVGGRVLARETLPALKKDVTGYLYGGDRTRKMKLWAKQKRGKERLKTSGRVEIPPAVFRELLRR
jgi:GTP-binding protein LepA